MSPARVIIITLLGPPLAGCATPSLRPATDEIPESELRVGNGPLRTDPPILAPDTIVPHTPWLYPFRQLTLPRGESRFPKIDSIPQAPMINPAPESGK